MGLISVRPRSYGWLVAAVGALLLLGNRGFRTLLSNWFELRKLRRQYASAQAEESSLKARLEEVRRSDFAIESVARRDLGYVKPGELEYRFPAPHLKQ